MAAVWLVLGFLVRGTNAAEVIPPRPSQYFNDYAGVVSPGVASQLNKKLEDFEKETSSQVVVAIYPKMESDSSIEDYAVRVAKAWRVGQKGKNNGVVLFVFIKDRKIFIPTGYGLEGALPDALAKRIIDEQITPAFKRGDYDAGLTAGVNAILKATKGEYTGTGATANARERTTGYLPIIVFVLFLIFIIFIRPRFSRTGFWLGGMSSGGWSSGGGWGGGGGGGSSGGGFSGGGGDFGGGGAGGSW